MQDSHGYLQPSDATMTSEVLEKVHTALMERRNSLVKKIIEGLIV